MYLERRAYTQNQPICQQKFERITHLIAFLPPLYEHYVIRFLIKLCSYQLKNWLKPNSGKHSCLSFDFFLKKAYWSDNSCKNAFKIIIIFSFGVKIIIKFSF